MLFQYLVNAIVMTGLSCCARQSVYVLAENGEIVVSQLCSYEV
jgi:hypothetical protein